MSREISYAVYRMDGPDRIRLGWTIAKTRQAALKRVRAIHVDASVRPISHLRESVKSLYFKVGLIA